MSCLQKPLLTVSSLWWSNIATKHLAVVFAVVNLYCHKILDCGLNCDGALLIQKHQTEFFALVERHCNKYQTMVFTEVERYCHKTPDCCLPCAIAVLTQNHRLLYLLWWSLLPQNMRLLSSLLWSVIAIEHENVVFTVTVVEPYGHKAPDLVFIGVESYCHKTSG